MRETSREGEGEGTGGTGRDEGKKQALEGDGANSVVFVYPVLCPDWLGLERAGSAIDQHQLGPEFRLNTAWENHHHQATHAQTRPAYRSLHRLPILHEHPHLTQ